MGDPLNGFTTLNGKFLTRRTVLRPEGANSSQWGYQVVCLATGSVVNLFKSLNKAINFADSL